MLYQCTIIHIVSTSKLTRWYARYVNMLYQNKSKSIYTACCMPRMVPVASHLFVLQSSKHASQSWLYNLYSPRQYENAWCTVKIGEHKPFPFFHALNPSRDICRVKADLHRCPGPPLSLTLSTCTTCWSASAWPWAQAPLKAKGGRGASRRSNLEPLKRSGEAAADRPHVSQDSQTPVYASLSHLTSLQNINSK